MASNAITTHWLAKTPDQLLNHYNASLTDPDMRCGLFTVRIFVFCQGSLLLTNNGNDWNVPTLNFTETTIDQTGNLNIRDEVLLHLKNARIPLPIIQDLQFMEYSRPCTIITAHPLRTDGTKINQIAISVILTTENAHLAQFLPYRMHWTTLNQIATLDIPASQASMTSSFSLQCIALANQRFLAGSKANLALASFTHVASASLLAILHARSLTTNEQTIGAGWIALDDSMPDGWWLMLFPAHSPSEALRPGIITDGSRNIRTVCRWGDEGIVWAEEISKWGNLIEEDGRLRAKRAPRERVLWSITTWEELFGEDEEEEMVRYAEKGEVSTLVLFNA